MDKLGGNSTFSFAAEILMVPTGAAIPYSYDVRNLISRKPSSAIEQMKGMLAKSGRLAIPYTAPVEELVAEPEADEGPGAIDEPDDVAVVIPTTMTDHAAKVVKEKAAKAA